MARARVVRSPCGYRVDAWRWWWPVWRRDSRHPTPDLAYARAAVLRGGRPSLPAGNVVARAVIRLTDGRTTAVLDLHPFGCARHHETGDPLVRLSHLGRVDAAVFGEVSPHVEVVWAGGDHAADVTVEWNRMVVNDGDGFTGLSVCILIERNVPL